VTQLVFNRDEELIRWAEATYPECAPIVGPVTTIGIVSSEGEIMAVAFYNNYRQNHGDIEISLVAATPRWATPGNIRALLHYPFVQLGVQRLTAHTTKANKRFRKILEHYGARLEGVHPYWHLGKQTGVSYGLYRDVAMKQIEGKTDEVA